MTVFLGKNNPFEIRVYNLSSRRHNVEKLTVIGLGYGRRGVIVAGISWARLRHSTCILFVKQSRLLIIPKTNESQLNFYPPTNHCRTRVVVYNILKRDPCVYFWYYYDNKLGINVLCSHVTWRSQYINRVIF